MFHASSLVMAIYSQNEYASGEGSFMIRLTIYALAILLLAACTQQRVAVELKQAEPTPKGAEASPYPAAQKKIVKVQEKVVKAKEKRLKAIGYGAESDYSNYPAPRKRLLAIRAAKLDAYRNLAETLYGTRITGVTTVKDAAIESDKFRAYVDAVVRGAQLLALTPKGEGLYEAELELRIDEDIFKCFASLTPACTGQTRTYEVTTDANMSGGTNTPPEVSYFR